MIGQREVETLSRTSLSCVLKPSRNPVPAREIIVPTAKRTAIAHELKSVNEYPLNASLGEPLTGKTR